MLSSRCGSDTVWLLLSGRRLIHCRCVSL